MPVINNSFYHGHPTTVAITIVVVWRPSVGGVNIRAFNRILGTLGGAIWSYLVLTIVYLVNGLTWVDTAAKWTVFAIMQATWGAFCALNMLRYKKYNYAWIVAALTPTIATGPAIRGSDAPWGEVGVRVLDVAIGIVIVWIVAFCFLPISTRRIVAANFREMLENLKTFASMLPDQVSAIKEQRSHGDSFFSFSPESLYPVLLQYSAISIDYIIFCSIATADFPKRIQKTARPPPPRFDYTRSYPQSSGFPLLLST